MRKVGPYGKRCGRCLRLQSPSAFGMVSGRPNGVCLECERKRAHEWYVNNRARKLADRAKRFIAHPERYFASVHVRLALADGRLRREPCWSCGNPKTDAHHPSYAPDAWLDVVWLCRSHHSEIHRNVERLHNDGHKPLIMR